MNDRQAAIMQKILTATTDSTRAALVREYAQIEAEIAVDAVGASVELAATDDWGRPRCQEIIRYVDTHEQVQCGMTEDHDGDCDPLPVWPDVEPQDEPDAPDLLARRS
jgi:hypothetical protein